MSRIFTHNASNKASLGVNAIGSRLNGASGASVAAWCYGIALNSGAGSGQNNSPFGFILSGNGNGGDLAVTFNTPNFFVTSAWKSASTDASGTATGATSLSNDHWYHLGCAVSFAAHSLTVYVNGNQDGQNNSTGFGHTTFVNSAGTNPDYVGANAASFSASTCFPGWLSDVAMWSGTLNAGEWAALAAGASPDSIRRVPLLAWWPMVRDGNLVIDRGPFHIDGAVSGSVPLGPDPPRPGRPPRKRRRVLDGFPVGTGGAPYWGRRSGILTPLDRPLPPSVKDYLCG
jgi:hypothetical protein